MTTLFPIAAFTDNYIWALYDQAGHCVVVDPGDAAPVEQFLTQRELSLVAILITHHHPDHVGGIEKLVAERGIPVYGPSKESIPHLTEALTEDDIVSLPFGLADCRVIDTPGHTLGHIVYYLANETPPILFAGDTLFAGGCGRLFEGTAAQMLSSLDKLAALPASTRLCCAHEYTQKNLRFALAVEPDSSALQQRINAVAALRQQQLPSLPSTLADELASNPFLRVDQPSVKQSLSLTAQTATRADHFAALRQWKDNF